MGKLNNKRNSSPILSIVIGSVITAVVILVFFEIIQCLAAVMLITKVKAGWEEVNRDKEYAYNKPFTYQDVSIQVNNRRESEDQQHIIYDISFEPVKSDSNLSFRIHGMTDQDNTVYPAIIYGNNIEFKPFDYIRKNGVEKGKKVYAYIAFLKSDNIKRIMISDGALFTQFISTPVYVNLEYRLKNSAKIA